jgi:succinate dehydrogenase / fumarate reductase cytochrome b subunit
MSPRSFSNPFTASIAKKTVMAVSGAMLCAFILVHMAGNASMFLGREAFNSYAHHLHDLGILLSFFEAALLTVFLLHIFFGVLLYIENLKARPTRYAVSRSKGGRTLGSRSMPYTGCVIFLFILFHLSNFQTIDAISPSNTVRQILNQPLYSFFYCTGILCLALHISHGCWSLFQSLGLNSAAYDRPLRQGALVFSIIVGIIFTLIPTFTLFVNGFLL